jgi:cell wall-associated NlpC family hydrolase
MHCKKTHFRYVSANFPLLILLASLLSGCASTGDRQGIDIPDGPRGQAVSAALGEIGTPYVYGASSPGTALDCSALTLHAHRAAGLQIPRVASAQYRVATPVPPSRVEPGDLVFFQVGDGHHVGLMVDARRFVHASTSARRVRLANLDLPYWRRRLIGAGSYFR